MIARLSSLLILAAALACGGQGASAQDRPGDCVTRRVTGPGGAYRWDRVECEAVIGWSHDPRALEVVDGPLRGDRYGGWSVAVSNPSDPSRPTRDGPPYSTYRAAGRDAGGFLVWPGKLQ